MKENEGVGIIVQREFKRFLKGTGMSQSDFAKLADVPQSTLNKIINGKCDPKLSVALKIIKATGGLLNKIL